MTSKNLSYKTLVRRNLSSRLWLVALTLLGSLGTLLLPLFMVRESFQGQMRMLLSPEKLETEGKEILQSAQEGVLFLLSMDNYVVKVALILLASVCGVAVFRYLHDRQQVDFYHALPINRTHLFIVNYVSGILMVLPIFVLVYAVTAGAAFSMGFGGLVTGNVIAHTVLGHSLFFLVNYTVMVMCTVLTGNTIITVLLALWVQFSLPLAAFMHQAWQMMLHVTFTVPSEQQMYTITNGSPIIKYFTSLTRPEIDPDFVGTFGMAVVWYPLVLGVVLLALSYVLFVRRRSERAGAAVAFEPLKAPLHWYMSLFMGSACALLFAVMFGSDNHGWAWFGLVLGVVLFHAIVEIIYEFDFRALFHHWKQMLILCAAAVAVFAGFRADIFGYDSYVPDQSQVEAVGLWTELTRNDLYMGPYENGENYPTYLQDTESIQTVIAIAQTCIPNLEKQHGQQAEPVVQQPEEVDFSENIIVAYQLKNGKKQVRSYHVPNKLVAEQLDTFLTSTAYGEKYLSLQRFQIPEQAADHSMELFVGYLGLHDDAAETPDAVDMIYKTADIRRVITTLQQEQMRNRKAYMHEVPVVQITLDAAQKLHEDKEEIYATHETTWDGDWRDGKRIYSYTIPVYPSDTETLQLLKELMGVQWAPLQAQNVKEIQIDLSDTTYEEPEWNREPVRVTDSETIAKFLENAYTERQRWDSGKYVLWEDRVYANGVSVYVSTQTDSMQQIYYEQGEAPVKLIEQLTGKSLTVG